jgi:hypothetical protein
MGRLTDATPDVPELPAPLLRDIGGFEPRRSIEVEEAAYAPP